MVHKQQKLDHRETKIFIVLSGINLVVLCWTFSIHSWSSEAFLHLNSNFFLFQIVNCGSFLLGQWSWFIVHCNLRQKQLSCLHIWGTPTNKNKYRTKKLWIYYSVSMFDSYLYPFCWKLTKWHPVKPYMSFSSADCKQTTTSSKTLLFILLLRRPKIIKLMCLNDHTQNLEQIQ